MPETFVTRISRRRLLLLLSVALGLAAAPPRSGIWGRATAPRDCLKHLLEKTLSNPEGARTIGRRFLEANPRAGVDACALADRLVAERPATSAGLRRVLARYRDEDLRQRKFVVVDGWILPRLEAEVCALAVIL